MQFAILKANFLFFIEILDRDYCRKESATNQNDNWYQLTNSDQSITCVGCAPDGTCCADNEVIFSITNDIFAVSKILTKSVCSIDFYLFSVPSNGLCWSARATTVLL